MLEDVGIYWMPVAPEQAEWLDSPSIFACRNTLKVHGDAFNIGSEFIQGNFMAQGVLSTHHG
jgi:hypothetical protein